MPIICYLCEEDTEPDLYLVCTKCMSFNGDPFVYCMDCANERNAVVAHQANHGNDHLFKRVAPPGLLWYCDICGVNLNGDTCYTCPTCPFDDGFDMCLKCSSPGRSSGTNPNHPHRMIPVLPDGTITQSHFTHSRLTQAGSGCWCDACGKEGVAGLILSCDKCCNPSSPCGKAGYDVCAKCADEDRATYLHRRWGPRKENHGTFTLLWGK